MLNAKIIAVKEEHKNHSHNHSHEVDVDKLGKRIIITIFLNILITISQIIGGLLSNSMALLSDALHNFSDVISLVISYIANILSKKEYKSNKTFGYRRAGVIAAFINSSTLVVIAVYLGIEAIDRITNPVIIESNLVIIMAFASIIINFISVVILNSGSKDNMNIKSAYLHLLSDVITSIAVMIGGLAMKYYNIYWLDSLLSILIAVYLLYVSWGLLTQSLKVLMQFVPKGIDIDNIVEELVKIDNVKNIHHVHVWQLDDHQIHFECHVDIQRDILVSEFEQIHDKIKVFLMSKGINHLTIQPEFDVDDDKNVLVQKVKI